MKSPTVLLTLLICVTASAQPVRDPACESYQPEAAEVAQIIDASADVPDSAELYSACVIRKLVQLRPGQLTANDTVIYQLVWDALERYRDVRVLRQAECTREHSGSIKCVVSKRLSAREGEGWLVDLEGPISSAREIFALLAFRDRRLGTDFRPLSIRREGRMDSVLGIHGDGRKIGYDLAITCESASNCTWNVLRQGEWRY